MKRVLSFHRKEAYNLIDLFTDELGCALNRLGVGFDVIDQPDKDAGTEQIARMLDKEHYDAVIVFNAEGQQDYELNGQNIWEMYDIPFYNYILDHPVEHQKEMRKPYKDMNVITIDSEHAKLASRWFPHLRSVNYIPAGGTGGIDKMDPDEWISRSKDIIYVGVHEDLEKMTDTIAGYPEHTVKLIGNIIDLMLDDKNMSYYQAFRTILADYGLLNDLSDEDELGYAVICRIASRYIRAYRREEIIRYILDTDNDWKLHIFGNGWDRINEESSNRAILHEPLPYSEMIKLYEDSKIVLNVMSHYKNAILDRIPSAMLSGACVLSESTDYLARTVPGDAIYFYDTDRPYEVPGMITDMLVHPERLFGTAQKGHEYAVGSLKWDNTAEKLIGVISTHTDGRGK